MRLLLVFSLSLLTIVALRLVKHAPLARVAVLEWTVLAAAVLSIAMLGLGVVLFAVQSLVRRKRQRLGVQSTLYAMIATIAIAILMLLQA